MYENSINVKDQFLKLTAWVSHTPTFKRAYAIRPYLQISKITSSSIQSVLRVFERFGRRMLLKFRILRQNT